VRTYVHMRVWRVSSRRFCPLQRRLNRLNTLRFRAPYGRAQVAFVLPPPVPEPMVTRRLNEAIDEALIVGMVSHDLRSPLGAITAAAALLAASAEADRAGIAGRILTSARRMERMIADLLDVTRTRLGGAIPLKRARTDLRTVCEEVVLELQAFHTHAVVHFVSHGDVRGEWDADRLAQVVSNLVGNAIEHGGPGPVTLEAADGGDRVTLTVHNGGEPIAKDVQATIFEPLIRGVGTTRNIGLGLFIARAIVVAHGGEIGLTSTEQSGTTFEVVLPRSPS
jgi:sigma-B regulation protein RsbU (phosphoserine phosphatase)